MFNIKKDLTENHLVRIKLRVSVEYKKSKQPIFLVPPQEIMQPHERITDLSGVHGRSPYSDSTVAEEGFVKDVQTLLCLQVNKKHKFNQPQQSS